MNYCVAEHLNGERISIHGPFPSQCQALSYAEHMREQVRGQWNGPMFSYQVGPMQTPSFMPERIHD